MPDITVERLPVKNIGQIISVNIAVLNIGEEYQSSKRNSEKRERQTEKKKLQPPADQRCGEKQDKRTEIMRLDFSLLTDQESFHKNHHDKESDHEERKQRAAMIRHNKKNTGSRLYTAHHIRCEGKKRNQQKPQIISFLARPRIEPGRFQIDQKCQLKHGV